jgi:hypothetical protein
MGCRDGTTQSAAQAGRSPLSDGGLTVKQLAAISGVTVRTVSLITRTTVSEFGDPPARAVCAVPRLAIWSR